MFSVRSSLRRLCELPFTMGLRVPARTCGSSRPVVSDERGTVGIDFFGVEVIRCQRVFHVKQAVADAF